jgi:hypothetical protein
VRQSIRALGWTITISMLILFAFLVTAVYSVFQTVLMEQGIRFGEPQGPRFLNNTFVLSIPVTVNNTGYYDITDFHITTTLKDFNGTTLTTDSAFIEKVGKGSNETRLLDLSLSLVDILSNMTYLLFNDTEFKIDLSVGLTCAYALSFHLTVTNMSLPGAEEWGAPLHGFTLRDVRLSSFNETHLVLDVFLEFENHSFFDIVGKPYLKVYNEAVGYIACCIGSVNVPSHSGFSDMCTIEIEIENPLNYTGKGNVEVYFELPLVDYTFELGSVSYG